MNIRGVALLIAGLLSAINSFAEELLPGKVLFELKETEHMVERVETAVKNAPTAEPKRTQVMSAAKSDMDLARAKIEAMEKRFADEYSPFHPDVVALQDRIEELDEFIRSSMVVESPPAATPATNSMQPGASISLVPPPPAGSAGYWLARLRPFVVRPGQIGYDANCYLEPMATSDPEQMQQRLEIYARASMTLTEYRQARLGSAATVELQQVALDIEAALQRFGLSCVEHANADLVKAQEAIQDLEQFVVQQNDRMAAAESIQLPDRDALRQLETSIARAASLVRPDDACFIDVRQRFDLLKRNDARLRAARASDTRMAPNIFPGSDALGLMQVAGRLVSDSQPGIRILRISLISPDWRVENFAEWADFDRLVLQSRVVRSISAHVAAQYNAETRLYTVLLRQDQLPSKAWGPVSGNILFVDPMLRENVK